MKLHKITRRDRFYQQGDNYKLLPVYRKPVVPGDSHAIDYDLKIQTAAFTKNIITDGMLSVFFFYVPNRLVWDEWVDFITQAEDFAGTYPTNSTAWATMYEKGGFTRHSFYRRAYKLIYNQYFGADGYQAGNADGWYDDITDDTVVALNDIKNTEQFAGRLVTEGELASPTFDATTVPIDLNDFYRQMQNARSKRRANMSGDKYVDALRRMGVEPDWRIQNAPEFLGRTDKDLTPVKTFNTTGTGTGDSVARFEGTLSGRVKRKMFAEHGFIVGVACMRPHVFNDEMINPPDAYQLTIDDYPLGDNLRAQDEYAENTIATANVADYFTQRFAQYRNGVHLTGLDDQWATSFTAAVQQEAVFITGNALPTSDELSSGSIALFLRSMTTGQTPVPPNAL